MKHSKLSYVIGYPGLSDDHYYSLFHSNILNSFSCLPDLSEPVLEETRQYKSQGNTDVDRFTKVIDPKSSISLRFVP